MSTLTLANSLKCTSFDGDTETTSSLNKFFNKISEGLGDAFEFIDDIEEVASDISDSMEGLTTVMSDFLEESVTGFITEGMQAAKNFLLSKFSLNPFAGLAQNSAFENAMFSPIDGLFKAFGCLGSTIKKAMKNTIKNMLANMVKGGFVNPIGCAIQDFIGALTGKITSMMSGIIEPLMAPINNMLKIVGKGFGSVKNFLLGGLNIISKIQGLINCADDESSAECHVVESYDLFTGPLSKKDDPEKQNRFSRAIDNLSKKITNEEGTGIGDRLDNLTGDIGNWGIFGGKRETTREDRLKEIDKELEELRGDYPSIADVDVELRKTDAEIDRLTKEIERINIDLNKTAYVSGDTSFAASRGLISNREQLRDELKAAINKFKKLEEILAKHKELNEQRKTVFGMEAGAIIKEDLGGTAARRGDIDPVELDCNSGNVFKCGLPKVSIFGGNGEGAVGDVILGNFIQELDQTISQTEYKMVTGTKTHVRIGDYYVRTFKKGARVSKRIHVLLENGNYPSKGKGYKPEAGARQFTKAEIVATSKLIKQNKYDPASRVDQITYKKTKIGGSITEDVKQTASIIGVDIKYPGEGYTQEPLIKFEDNCKQGYGAYGKAIIDKDPNSPTFGQLTDVLIISEGINYPADTPEDAFVDKIVVEDGGIGYTEEDTIEDFEICGLDENGTITKVCTNAKPYRSLPKLTVNSRTGSGAILTPIMTRKPKQMEVITVIDCITPRNNIVGYVNGKEYNGPFHVHPETGQKMVGLAHTTRAHATIYNTPQESLRSGGSPTSNVGSTKIQLRSIQTLITESETSQTPTETYTDPMDEAGGTTPPPSTPPSTPPSSPPPSSPPPSSPPSSGGGGYGGGY